MNEIENRINQIDEIDFNNLQFGKTFTDHMIVVKYENEKWNDILLLPYGPISILPSISALHYGQSVFEGMKVFLSNEKLNNTKNNIDNVGALVFRIDSHFERINKSLERMEMPKISKEIWMESIRKLIKNDMEWLRRAGQLYLRPFVFATTPYLGVAPAREYSFILLACPVGAYYSKPLNLKIETKYSRSAPGGVGFAKTSGNYAASLHPTVLAQKDGFDQLIWTDSSTHTKIEESGTMNLMCVIGGKIITPKLSETILSGITRDSFLKLAQNNNIMVEEKELTISEFISAIENGALTELFGVGTAATMIPVSSVTYNNKKYNLSHLLPNYSICTKLAKKLDEIKRGITNDANGWVTQL